VIDLIIGNHSSRVFQEAIELAIALLDGGNSVIQVCQKLYDIIFVCVYCSSHCFVAVDLMIGMASGL